MHHLTRLCLALFALTAVACEDGGPDTGTAESETDTESATDGTTGTAEPGPVTAGQGTIGQPPGGDDDDTGDIGQPPGDDDTGDESGDDTGDDTVGMTTLAPPKVETPEEG